MKWIFFILFAIMSCSQVTQEPIAQASRGFLDLSKYDFQQDRVFSLDGEWEFYWKQFIVSQPVPDPVPSFLEVPGIWNGKPYRQEEMTGNGYGSYRLKVVLPKGHDHLAIISQDLATSYRLYVNRELIIENGIPATTAEASSPQFKPDVGYIKGFGQDIEIVVEIANYSHSKGGFWESMRIGSIRSVHNYREKRLGFDLFLTGSLLIMGIYHIGLFSLRRNDKSSLFLGVFCFIMIIRILTTGDRILFTTFENINWEFGLKLEYFTFYLATPVFALFLRSLYPEEFKEIILKILIVGSIFFVGIVLVTPTRIFARTAIPFQIFTVIGLIYAIFALIKAIVKKKQGSFVALLGFAVLFATIINDILYNNGLINTAQLSPFGLFAFIFSQAFLLSVRFSKAFFSVELLSKDLSQTNQSYSRFVPKEFLSFLEKDNINDVMLGDQVQKEMTILFCDIRAFTTLSESMTPEENFNFINDYLKLMNPIIRTNRGFIDKYIGDAIMALFPVEPDDAIKAGLQMFKELDEFNKSQSSKGKPPIKIGIGIHTGSLMLGTVGDSERMEGTVISDAVNLASRLEGLTKIYGASLIVSEKTIVNINDMDQFLFRFLGRVEVKGKKEPAPIYEIFNLDTPEIRDKKIETKTEFEMAINAFFNGDMDKSFETFQSVFFKNKYDLAAYYYMQKCKISQSFTDSEILLR
jgi:adenylate cyclase